MIIIRCIHPKYPGAAMMQAYTEKPYTLVTARYFRSAGLKETVMSNQNESAPQSTQLPVVGSAASDCPKTSKDGAAKSGCSACGKCRRNATATEGTAPAPTSSPADKQEGSQS